MADDKQAMLEKIRADMARTKERLAAMKASSSPSPSRPTTSVTARSPTVERSGSAGSGAGEDKAPAAATGAGSAPASGASDASSSGDGKDKEKEKKLSDAQAMIESLRAKKAAATSGAASTRSTATPAATGATLSPASAAAPERQRRPTWASKTPDAARGLTAAPTVGRGSGSGETAASAAAAAAAATASAGAPSSTAGGAAGAADGASGEKRGKNIRSLADLQAAIRKADHVKSKAQNQSQLEELRRQRQMRREARKTMTKEERVAYRKSVRQSLRMEQKKSEKKVGAQINSFMTMLQTLETEWAKQEEARFQKEQELLEIKSNLASMGDQCVAIGKVLENASHQMDHLKNVLDRLVTSMPPKVKKVDEKWSEDLLAFQSNYWQMRHTLYVQTAKHNKEMATLGESMGKDLKLSNTPSAPAMPSPRSGPPGTAPPMPAAPAAAPVRQANPISALLSQIRGGTSLKKLDPEQVKREKAQRRAHIRKSMALLQDLQDTLTDALQTRQAAMLDSDEEDDEDYEGWSDEDEDE